MALQLGCFLGMFFFLACVLYTLCNRKYRKYFVLCKMLCSTMFLVMAFLMGISYGKMDFFFRMLPALLFCYLGDLLLGFHNRTRKKSYFLVGTLAFGMGHVCFLIMLYAQQPFGWCEGISVILFPTVIALLSKNQSFHFGHYKYMAMLYAILVGTFGLKSLSIAIENPVSANILMAVGGMMFLLSDGVIFLISFWKRRVWAFHGLNLVTYYLAMSFLAVSIAYR